jgi:hypothetical protein
MSTRAPSRFVTKVIGPFGESVMEIRMGYLGS